MPPLQIASRKSPLALAQADAVALALRRAHPERAFAVRPLSTRGDQIADRPLADIGGKELFTKALQNELLANRAHFAVHSLKDMAAETAPPFAIAAIGFAEDPRDAVVSQNNIPLREMKNNARVGTCSPRRAALVAKHFPHLAVVPMRGNLQTRFAKLQRGECDALVLALAGLRRMKIESRASEILPAEMFIPAVGQGLLAVECARSEHAALAAPLDDPAARTRALAERAFAAAIGGNCHTPLGAYAVVKNGVVKIHAFLATDEKFVEVKTESSSAAPEQSGRAAAEQILAQRN